MAGEAVKVKLRNIMIANWITVQVRIARHCNIMGLKSFLGEFVVRSQCLNVVVCNWPLKIIHCSTIYGEQEICSVVMLFFSNSTSVYALQSQIVFNYFSSLQRLTDIIISF